MSICQQFRNSKECNNKSCSSQTLYVSSIGFQFQLSTQHRVVSEHVNRQRNGLKQVPIAVLRIRIRIGGTGHLGCIRPVLLADVCLFLLKLLLARCSVPLHQLPHLFWSHRIRRGDLEENRRVGNAVDRLRGDAEEWIRPLAVPHDCALRTGIVRTVRFPRLRSFGIRRRRCRFDGLLQCMALAGTFYTAENLIGFLYGSDSKHWILNRVEIVQRLVSDRDEQIRLHFQIGLVR